MPTAQSGLLSDYTALACAPKAAAANSKNEEHIGRSAKMFGGYQLTENFGVQAGYVRIREINQSSGSGATLVTQTASGHSTYVAGTARLPLGQSFALTGRGRRFLLNSD